MQFRTASELGVHHLALAFDDPADGVELLSRALQDALCLLEFLAGNY